MYLQFGSVGPFLPQQGLTRPWLAAPRRQPCPLPASTMLGLAACCSSGLARLCPSQDLVVQGEVLCTMSLLLSPKMRVRRSLPPALLIAPQGAAPTRFGQEEPHLLFSVQVPHHNSSSRLSLPAQPRRGWIHQSQKAAEKWGELHHCQPHLTCMVFASKQAPVTS